MPQAKDQKTTTGVDRAVAVGTSIALALVVGGVMEAAADNLQQSTQPSQPGQR